MNTKTKVNQYISPARKKRLIEEARYYLFVLGYSQNKTAELIGISGNSLSLWVKKLGWQDKLKGRDRVEYAETLKVEKNLPMFIAYIRVKHPEEYDKIAELHNKFINKHK